MLECSHEANENTDSETEMLDPLTSWVRQLLQNKYLENYIRSLTNEEARNKVKYYFSDLVHEQTQIPVSIPYLPTLKLQMYKLIDPLNHMSSSNAPIERVHFFYLN